jgi:hypothetical protein
VNFWKVILATIVIFGAGVFTGGLLVDNVDHSHPRFSRRPQTPPEARSQTNRMDAARPQDPSRRQPEMFSRQFVQQLDDALQLTPEQRDKITKVIADGQERNRQIWAKVMQDVQQRIHTELTTNQWKQFEVLMKPHTSRRPMSGTNAQPDSAASTNLPPPTLTNAPGV